MNGARRLSFGGRDTIKTSFHTAFLEIFYSKPDIGASCSIGECGLEADIRCRAAFGLELSFHPTVCEPVRRRHRARAAEIALPLAVGVVISNGLGTLGMTPAEETR